MTVTAMPAVARVRHAYLDLPTGVCLHVAESGAREAPAVLALHGWPQHWWMWRDVIGPLASGYRVVCPDLRGLGWSGQPADGDFTKQRLADDMLALLDVLELDEVDYLGHDWGGWTGWLLALRAPERVRRLLNIGIPHPWAPRFASLLNAWRTAYQFPLATPVLGPLAIRSGHVAHRMLAGAMDRRTAAVFADVLREPERAAASSALYRQFQLREVPALLAGRLAGARLAMPVKLLAGRGDPTQHPSQLEGLQAHAVHGEVELVEGGHFLVDERPELIAERALHWFAEGRR